MKHPLHVQVIAVILGVLVIALFFGIMPQLEFVQSISEQIRFPGYMRPADIPPPPGIPPPAPPPGVPAVIPGEGGSPLVVDWSYRAGRHTLVGVISTPTPCHGLHSDVIVAESYPEQVTVNFMISPPASDEVCLQVIDQKPFNVSFEASRNAKIRATLNGEELDLMMNNR